MPAADDVRFALRLSAFYCALFLVYGVHLPYLPVWLDARGLSPSEIAIVTAAPFFVRLLVTPAVALVADARAAHRQIVIALACVAVVAGLALAGATSFWPILALATSFALCTSTIMPLTETIAMTGVRAGKADYGRMRLWGSLTFVLAGFAGGVAVDHVGAGAGVWLIEAGAVVTALTALLLPASAPGGALRAAEAEREVRQGYSRADVLALVTAPAFLLFLTAAGAVQGAHATFYTFGALHWKAQGLSASWTGALWAIAVVAEVLVFAWSRELGKLVSPLGLILSGAIAALLRWAAMTADPPLAALIPLQALHGLTYGATHLGAMHFIAEAVPVRVAGTAQALYATMASGVFMGATTLASGPLYAAWKGGAYAGPAFMAAISIAAVLVLARLWPGGQLALGAAQPQSSGPDGAT